MKKRIDFNTFKKAGEKAHLKTEKVAHAQLEIDIAFIKENPYQPRISIDEKELKELAFSIEKNGLLQPIALKKIDSENYELISGHRRLAAHKILNKSRIKATIITLQEEEEKDMTTLALIENIQRKNLTPLEIALSFQHLLSKKFFSSQDELALSIGKSKSYITKILSILKLENSIIDHLKEHKTIKDLDMLYNLQKVENKKEQVVLFEEIKAGNLDRQSLREKIKNQKVSHAQSSTPQIEFKKESIYINSYSIKKSDKESFKKELEALLLKYSL